MPGHIPEAVIDDIRQRADIVDVIGSYIALKRRGNDYWAACPFHQEKTPSFKVNSQHQSFYCFGCQASGNVFHFIQQRENVDFVGAVRLLAQRCGVIIPEPENRQRAAEGGVTAGQRKEILFALLDQAAGWFEQQLHAAEGQVARDYLRGRGLDSDTIAGFRLGYAPDSWDATLAWGARRGYDTAAMIAAGLAIAREDATPGRLAAYDRFRGRLTFPICDELGRVVGFSARILTADAKAAKYINSPETAVFSKGRLLYGLHAARKAFREHGGALVCEGQLDVIACHRAGLTHAVAPQGTAFTETHARLLKRFAETVTFAFDADAAGEKAAVRSIAVAQDVGLAVRVVALPAGDDPDSLYRRGGPEALRTAMAAAQEALGFVLNLTRKDHDLRTPEGKDAVANELLELIMTLPSPVQRSASCQWLSRQIAVPEAALFEALNRKQRAKERQTRRGEPAATGAPVPTERLRIASTSVADKALAMLLDLALHHRFIAHELAQHLPPERLGALPAARALNLVIAATEGGDWTSAGAEIAHDHELAGNPDIARLLTDSQFGARHVEGADDETRATTEKVLLRAMQDCLDRLEADTIEQRTREIQEALATEKDPANLRLLQIEFSTLLRRRSEFSTPGKARPA